MKTVEDVPTAVRQRLEMLTTRQVCDLLQVSRTWVSREAAAGRLPHVRIGRQYRFRAEDVEALIR